MKLTPSQIAEFEEQGFLFLPSLFTTEEMNLLNAEVPGLLAADRPEVVRERGTEAPRTAFYVQTWNDVFARLARHPRLVEPGMQLLGFEKLYMHQFKINAKAAFDGAVWQWHQDYGTWFEDDDMPAPKAMNIALFLAEANEFNGPLMFIPKSHRAGKLAADHDVTTTSYPLWTIDNATITRLVQEGHRGAQGTVGLGVALPLQSRACLGLEPDAVVALDRLSLAQSLRQRDPPLQSPHAHREPRFHADRPAARRLPHPPCAGTPARRGITPRALAFCSWVNRVGISTCMRACRSPWP